MRITNRQSIKSFFPYLNYNAIQYYGSVFVAYKNTHTDNKRVLSYFFIYKYKYKYKNLFLKPIQIIFIDNIYEHKKFISIISYNIVG